MATEEKPVMQKTLPANLVSVISKSLRDHRKPSTMRYAENGDKNIELVRGDWLNISSQRGRRNTDNQKILRLLPDLERCLSILIPAILSPGDMLNTSLNYIAPKNLVSSELSATLLQTIEEYFTETYDIKSKLSLILRDILAIKGSHSLLVLPESAIDAIINGNSVSTESYRIKSMFTSEGYIKPLNILGNGLVDSKKENDTKKNTSLESLFFEKFNTVSANPGMKLTDDGFIEHEKYIKVFDNPDVFKIPKLQDAIAQEKLANKKSEGTKDLISVVMESISINNNDKDNRSEGEKLRSIDRAVFNRVRNSGLKEVIAIPNGHTIKRKSVGAPLIMKCPSEAVLPVHVPGDFHKHIGYFILIDNNGNMMDLAGNQANCENMSNNLRANNGVGSDIIKKVDASMHQSSKAIGRSADYLAQMYAEMVERDLVERVKNGSGLANVGIASNHDFYRIMFARYLANQYTQLIYVPAEYMTYMAFDYDENGIGKSILDDISVINTLRVVLMFNDVMASVKNSIGRTKVKAHIDESDPNPMKTMEIMMDTIVKSRAINLPMSVNDPADIITFIQKAGYEWEFEGNPKIPTTTVDFENKTSSVAKSDEALSENLKKMSALAFGIPPEMVDNSFNSEFATTSIMNNTLFMKHATNYQNSFTPFLNSHHKQVIKGDSDLLTALRDIVIQNKTGIKVELKDLIPNINAEEMNAETSDALLVMTVLDMFISNLTVELPKPPSITMEASFAELDKYIDGIDKYLNAYISEDFMTSDTTGELSSQITTYKAMIKAMMIRNFMNSKNILPELNDLVTLRENGDPCLNIIEEAAKHIEALTKSGLIVKSILNNNKKLVDDKLAENGDQGSSTNSSDDNTSGGFGDTSEQSDDDSTNNDDGEGTDLDTLPEDDGSTDTTTEDEGDDANKDTTNTEPDDNSETKPDNEKFPE